MKEFMPEVMRRLALLRVFVLPLPDQKLPDRKMSGPRIASSNCLHVCMASS